MEFKDTGFVLREINTKGVPASVGILNIRQYRTQCRLRVGHFVGGLKPVPNMD